LLIPSAVVAWINLDMPQFGSMHDDSIYFVVAKAWSAGEGHRIISLPGQPWQTKYPPLYPLLLSAIWRVDPQFPGNLRIATVLSWLLLPPMLYLIRLLYRRYDFPAWWAWLLVAILAINPYVQLFSISLLSEIPFTLMLLGVLLLAPGFPVAAAIIAGLAYLTRTAALPLLLAIPAVYVMKRRRRDALLFAAGMLPFVLGWSLWTKAHKPATTDPYLMYYIDYVWYQFYNVNLSNVVMVLWKNIDAVLTGMGTLVMPFAESPLTKMMVQTIAVGMIVGIYRLARDREGVRGYALYGALFTIMLVSWHYPPNARFLFPIFPLLLAGFSYQIAMTVTLIRKAYADPRQKIAAVVIAGALLALSYPVLRNNYLFMFHIAPSSQSGQRRIAEDNLPCAARIREELPAGAKIMASNDPTMYLLTGLTSLRMTVPPVYWYEERFEEMLAENVRMPQVAREHGMTHLYVNRGFRGDLTEQQQQKFLAAIGTSADLKTVFQCGAATLYEIR
jgi:hypothetical protein